MAEKGEREGRVAARASELGTLESTKTTDCQDPASQACTDAKAAWQTVFDAVKEDKQLLLE